ncbi:hypothetical protein JXA80_03555 [bacterium]|nr:hypothetical protein [candidate division CSSED10-310 bacterium]
MNRILILVDHPQRDLAGMVLCAVELHRLGIHPYLASMHQGHSAVFNLVPDAVLVPFCRDANAHFIRALFHKGIMVFVLDTEGGIISSLADYAATIASDPDSRMCIETYFSWGPRVADYLTDTGVFLEDQVTVTGHPRFDYYYSPYKEALEARWSRSREKAHRIMIASTFTLVNPRFTDRDTEIEILKRAGVSQVLIDKRVETESRAIEAFIKLTRRLSREFPGIQWVLRPHPFEDETIYDQCIVGDNVFIEREGEIRRSFHQSTALIHHGSTTGLEAAIQGLPVFETAWLKRWAELPAVHAAGRQCQSEDMLVEAIRDLVKAGDTARKLNEDEWMEIESWAGPLDGRSAIRLAHAMASRMRNARRPNRHEVLREYYGVSHPFRFHRLAGAYLRWWLNLPASHAFRKQITDPRRQQRNAIKSFGIDDIREWLLIVGERGINVVITDSGTDLFVVDPAVPVWKICKTR